MTLTEIKNKLANRKEFNTTINRTRNKIVNRINQIQEMHLQGKLDLESESLLITTEGQLSDYIDNCIRIGEYVLDVETTGLDYFNDVIVGICLYAPGIKPSYIPINHTDIDNNRLSGQIEEDIAKRHIGRLCSSDAKYINHNMKFDIKFLYTQWGVYPSNPYWDTKCGSFVLNENEPSHSLKPLYDKYVLKTQNTKSGFGDIFGDTPFNYVPVNLAYLYGANDGYKTYKLYEFQKQYLDLNVKREDFRLLAKVFHEIEMPIISVVVDMELTGIQLDLDRASELEIIYGEKEKEYLTQLNQYLKRYESKINKHTKLNDLLKKKSFNFNSSTQLKYLCYDILNLPVVAKEKGTGKEIVAIWQTMDSIPLEKQSFLKLLVDYKQTQKLLGSFIQKLPTVVEPKTNAIHCNFNPNGAKTSRFSSSEPNLQQIPSKNKDIRTMFKARPGYVFVGSDLSQIEPRIVASLSKDTTMLDAYNNSKDLYSTMAAQIYGMSYEDCLEFYPDGSKNSEGKQRRTNTKSILLGILYGRQAKSIGEQTGLSEKDAQAIIDRFFQSFPNIKLLDIESKHMAESLGYVTMITGRKRRLPNTRSRDKWVKSRAERQCLNARIQGSSAELLKIAMIRLYKNERFREIGKLLLTVHDELIAEIKEEFAIEGGEILSNTMKSVCEEYLGMKQKCDVEYAYRWSDTIEL